MPWPQVLRIFGFTTGGAGEITCCPGRLPVQPAPFKYNEAALRHYDFFMSACAKVPRRCSGPALCPCARMKLR
jgi:hypothetical protein